MNRHSRKLRTFSCVLIKKKGNVNKNYKDRGQLERGGEIERLEILLTFHFGMLVPAASSWSLMRRWRRRTIITTSRAAMHMPTAIPATRGTLVDDNDEPVDAEVMAFTDKATVVAEALPGIAQNTRSETLALSILLLVYHTSKLAASSWVRTADVIARAGDRQRCEKTGVMYTKCKIAVDTNI